MNRGRAISLALSFTREDEARGAFGKLADGEAVKFPFELQPWGAYYGEIEDKFGVSLLTKLIALVILKLMLLVLRKTFVKGIAG